MPLHMHTGMDTAMIIDNEPSVQNSGCDALQLTRLLQLASPALPVGAFAWSEGLEFAVHTGWVNDESSARQWILGVLANCVARLDVPMFQCLHRAWRNDDEVAVREHSRWLLACRESAELRAGDRQLGQALARVLVELGETRARAWCRDKDVSFAAMFALASARWHIQARHAAIAMMWSWCENMVASSIKLVPLGHSAGQRLLYEAGALLPELCVAGFALERDCIAGGAPGLALASAAHETQRTRLFRS
jgi:urease accessory protein